VGCPLCKQFSAIVSKNVNNYWININFLQWYIKCFLQIMLKCIVQKLSYIQSVLLPI